MSDVKTYSWISAGMALMCCYIWGWVWLYLPEFPLHDALASHPVAFCAALGIVCALPFFVYAASLETSQPFVGMRATLWKTYGVAFLIIAELANFRFSGNETYVSLVFSVLYDRPGVVLICLVQTVPFGVAAWFVLKDRAKAVLVAAVVVAFATLSGLVAQPPAFDLYRFVYNVAGAAAGSYLAWSYAQGTQRFVRLALLGVDVCLAGLVVKEALLILAV